MYKLEVRKNLDKVFGKLSKKDQDSLNYINKKVKEILENPYHFKLLKAPMQNFRRVHIGNFVLIYSVDESKKTVILERYEHHDKVYKV